MMHKLNEDCFYFLTSSCTKGSACLYRHNPLALKSNVICPAWIRGQCLDAACPLRHSNVTQRPMISHGILCFYENMPTGCLKVDCTFIHTRPRTHLNNPSMVRPPSMNLVNKDVSKLPTPSSSSVSTPVAPVESTPPSTSSQCHSSVMGSGSTNCPATRLDDPQTTPVEKSPSHPEPSSPKRKTEIIVRRVAVTADSDPSIEKTANSSDTVTTPTKTTSHRCVITSADDEKNEETPNTSNLSRLVVNSNVVLPESTTTSTRTIVQTNTPNRVVVTSKTNSSPTAFQVKRSNGDGENLIEQENETKKCKNDSPSIVPNSSINAISSTSNTRLLLLATKQSTTKTEERKPTRVNCNRLLPEGNTSKSVSRGVTEQKISTGTGLLSGEDARRTSRLERFKNKPNSPPTSSPTQQTNSALSNRNVIPLGANGTKRSASISISQNSPPAKRTLTQQDSSTSQSTAILNHLNTKKSKDEPMLKTSPVSDKSSPLKTTTTVIASPIRPRFKPQIIRPPSPVSTNKTKSPPVVIKRPPATPLTTPSETSNKPLQEQPSKSNASENSSSKTAIASDSVKTLNEENGDPLSKLNESSNVVDTFALIDAALMEADHLLELI